MRQPARDRYDLEFSLERTVFGRFVGDTIMLRIQRMERNSSVVFALSGRFESGHATELKRLMHKEQQSVVLDLREVRLIARAVVEFLAMCETNGIELRNCPPYVREWISRERERAQEDRANEDDGARQAGKWN